MRLNSVNISFKSNITFDIGGSQREGSCKIRYATSVTDKKIYKEHTTVKDLGKGKFVNNDDFIEEIAKKIKRVQKDNKKIIEKMGYSKDENALKNIAIFLPSYTSNNIACYLPNLKNLEDKPLKEVDFSNLKNVLKEQGVEIADDVNIKILQDAMGTGLTVAKKLLDKGELQEGRFYTSCITGGGCGIADIEVVDDAKVLIKSRGSTYLSQSLEAQKVSKTGASAPAVITNFCRGFGLNEEIIEDIRSCHLAEFTIDEVLTMPKNIKTEKLKKFLLKTERYEEVSEDKDSYTIKVKNQYLKNFDKARRNAIYRYCLALARLAIIKKNEGSNGMIITGPLAAALNRATIKNSYNSGIAQWVEDILDQSFNSYELNKMQEIYKFKVFCNDDFYVDDNTDCENLVYASEFVGQDRGNWLKLDLKKLKSSNHNSQYEPTNL